MKKFCLITIFWLLLETIFGQMNVRFSGYAPQWAGYNIVFNKTLNYIVHETVPFIVLQIGQDGAFDFSFEVDEITWLYADVGRFKAYIYVEPNMHYQLVFPPFELKTETQRLSHHFQPEEIPFGIQSKESQTLNRNIFEFKEEFDFQFNSNAQNIFSFNKKELVNDIETSLEEQFIYSHPFFIKHKQLSYLKLQHVSQRIKERYFINELSKFEVAYNMPIYWDVFMTFVSGFLPRNFSGTSEIKLSSSINTKMRFDSLTTILTTDTIFRKREFAEICLLYTLYEAYYNNTISKSSCLYIIRSACDYSSTAKNREIATNFYKRMTMLLPGTVAPEFALLNKKGKTKELKDYSGKFVYLNFMHPNNHACLNDMRTIEALEKIFRKDLEIVTIFINEDPDDMVEFLKNNPNYKWEFLHFNVMQRIIFDYNIKAVPLYFLIDPKGNLRLSPAPAPNENFRQIFSETFQEYKRDELRNNRQKEKSIFDW